MPAARDSQPEPCMTIDRTECATAQISGRNPTILGVRQTLALRSPHHVAARAEAVRHRTGRERQREQETT
jgi:hypothetical protein